MNQPISLPHGGTRPEHRTIREDGALVAYKPFAMSVGRAISLFASPSPIVRKPQ
jgi:hypothetical protein